MSIVILSRKPGLPFNNKIEKIAKSANLRVEIIDPLACELFLDGNKSEIIVNNKPLKQIDFVIPRMGPAILEYGIKVLRHFELLNIPVLNSSLSIVNLSNRFEYLQIIANREGILVPKSMLIRKSKQIKQAIKKVNGPPAILRVLSSSDKLGAMLIENAATAESILDVNFVMSGLSQIAQSIIIEEYIKESQGKSYHLLVLGNEVIGAFYKLKAFTPKQSAAMRDLPTKGFVSPSNTMKHIAINTVETLNLDFALVSILESIDGPKIYEVEINPDISIFEGDPNLQIPAKIMAYITQKIHKHAVTGID